MCGRILGNKPLPSLRGVFLEVRHEEGRRRVMLGSQQPISPTDASVLIAHKPSFPHDDHSGTKQSSQPFNNNGKFKQGRPWCEKCRKPNHTVDTCWKIHGKPADWKPARDRRANSVVTENQSHEAQLFTKEQLDILQKLFNQTISTPTSSLVSTDNVVHQGKSSIALSTQHELSNSWIVDSRASYHMVGNLKFFAHFSSCKDSHTIRIVNGSYSHMAGYGSIQLTPNIFMKSVLLSYQ